MGRVKGTLLLGFVKTIRANKTGAYDSLPAEEDKKIISGNILATSWYPEETYKNCFWAVV